MSSSHSPKDIFWPMAERGPTVEGSGTLGRVLLELAGAKRNGKAWFPQIEITLVLATLKITG